LDYAIYTDRGKIRNKNEDSYLLKKEPYPLIAVADGMGGHQAGEIASKLAVNSLADYNFNYKENILKEIEEAIKQINQHIVEEGSKNKKYREMGTTLSMGIIYKQRLYLGHIGDSRIYLLRDDTLNQLTTDHSLVHELLEKKEISCNEAFDHPQKHIITQALGLEIELKIETKKIKLKEKDLLLFCTDGLTDMIRTRDIENIINSYIINNNPFNLEELSNILGEKAISKGGNDNITIIVAFI